MKIQFYYYIFAFSILSLIAVIIYQGPTVLRCGTLIFAIIVLIKKIYYLGIEKGNREAVKDINQLLKKLIKRRNRSSDQDKWN
jgi:hypothetical protein